ncbi:MAG: putative fluoride ion transporter CrcB [Alphaproteobacteria bacterium]|nr:MAG: putative fluoride ion transporter CrcB [Alphaproteobacteria bacterium]
MLVATGGATGAILRYILTNISKTLFASSIYGTISVNILGSFLIGYFITSNFGKNLSENFIKFFLIIGFLGSFTTFSAFSYEVVDLINSKKYLYSFTYIFISIFICILSAYLGMLINKF